MALTLAIETRKLVRRFGRHIAVAGIDLQVPRRSVFGFLGQNGAGKTTTICLLLGLLKPSAGSAHIFGLDVASQRLEAARTVGALVETPCHYDHLTGFQNLEITRRLLSAQSSEIGRVLEVVELSDAADRRVGEYSLGMRQRLGVARALLAKPRLLILDEPTNGLDPSGVRDMRSLIAELPREHGVTVLVSSHVLAEVEQVATHLGLIHDGRLLLQSPIESLKAKLSKRVRFRVDRAEDLLALLASMKIQAAVDAGGWVQVAESSAAAAVGSVPMINRAMVERGFQVSGIHVAEPSLEDIFISATGAAASSAPSRLAA
jgi:ABC-2 type transport system ATP-binding protein